MISPSGRVPASHWRHRPKPMKTTLTQGKEGKANPARREARQAAPRLAPCLSQFALFNLHFSICNRSTAPPLPHPVPGRPPILESFWNVPKCIQAPSPKAFLTPPPNHFGMPSVIRDQCKTHPPNEKTTYEEPNQSQPEPLSPGPPSITPSLRHSITPFRRASQVLLI